jgi:hypothetical protein
MGHRFMYRTVYGVDFSGARLAGRYIWLARLQPGKPRFQLTDLKCLEKLCGTPERGPALAHLVQLIWDSDRALWGLDFPFGLPIEVLEPGCRWPGQLDFLACWADDAYGLGLECVRRARLRGGPVHIRRQTDAEVKTPFDCYHYRIIFQTFFGMRDVLGPLCRDRTTAILPFHYRRLKSARRLVVEACPASTLKRLGLPSQNYKQPAGGPLLPRRLQTRRRILEGLDELVAIGPRARRIVMRNSGGDALDAILAALGAAQAWDATDHRAVAGHARYPLEGRVFS